MAEVHRDRLDTTNVTPQMETSAKTIHMRIFKRFYYGRESLAPFPPARLSAAEVKQPPGDWVAINPELQVHVGLNAHA